MSSLKSIFFTVFTLFLLFSCYEKGQYGKFVTSKVDTVEFFFSGEYSTHNDKPYFRDCATGLSHPIALKSDEYRRMYEAYNNMATTSGEGIYTTVKGYINDSNEMVVDKLLDMDLGYLCNPLTLSRKYCRDSDTLILFDNYTYNYSYKNDKNRVARVISGSWAKTYDDMGVLMINSSSDVIPFIINKGGVNAAHNLSLSFKDIEGGSIILMPN